MEENNKSFFNILINNNVSMEMTPLDQQINYVKPDDDFDFHAYRILLLINICGSVKTLVSKNPVLFGRRKFAFFDFLIRYPFYLEKVLRVKKKSHLIKDLELKEYEKLEAFSPMIHYLRGPWDNRYDDIFNYMISKDLIELEFEKVTKSGKKQFCITLTDIGLKIARNIIGNEPLWVKRMQLINNVFTMNTTNEAIDKLIFNNFPELILGGGKDVY
ncbi:ABC-three component system middle component 4 [Peribacillus frigoritolerans]|uniref:ABC-three component system middle component 4 n=1 Tax=Peribacillus frigoritolerans TaxID=450367 RepID=UPI002079E0F9|nr:ABC-three component system middle component 4 [Peribacillus frigoritolerans]USK65876.1 hypothetical protein LIT26_04255 [Peribacillus frigoritolerans]